MEKLWKTENEKDNNNVLRLLKCYSKSMRYLFITFYEWCQRSHTSIMSLVRAFPFL